MSRDGTAVASPILRGNAARSARPAAFGLGFDAEPSDLVAVGPWADSYQEIHTRARADGYRDGLAAGRVDGLALARQEAFDHSRLALDALDRAQRHLASIDAVAVGDVAGTVVELALELAGMILQREVAHSADPARDAIARVLPLAPEHGPLVIRLNPEDRAALGDASGIAPGRDVTLLADPALSRGDAVVDVGPSRIDGRLRLLLDQVAQALHREEGAPCAR